MIFQREEGGGGGSGGGAAAASQFVAGCREHAAQAGGITIFKSVGSAMQDVAVAAAVLDAAEKKGLGVQVGVRVPMKGFLLVADWEEAVASVLCVY